MVEARHGAQTSASEQQESFPGRRENEPPAGIPPQQQYSAFKSSRGQKRQQPTDDDASSNPFPKKQQISSDRVTFPETISFSSNLETTAASHHPTIANVTRNSNGELISQAANRYVDSEYGRSSYIRNPGEHMETYNAEIRPSKPPLQVENLQFDYDRSQMRDPRATPGRDSRPYYEKLDDIPVALLERLQATRSVYKSTRSDGRLTNAVKNDMFVAESKRNPWENQWAINRCFDKGREGSPTYDSSGFQLDYDKVCRWLKPQVYNKRRVVRGMEKVIEKGRKEREAMYRLFFVDEPKDVPHSAESYLKDQVSKDLGIPWHQIGSAQVKLWRDRGFQPVKHAEWYREPTEVESMRLMRMMRGASLRKDIWPPGTKPKTALPAPKTKRNWCK